MTLAEIDQLEKLLLKARECTAFIEDKRDIMKAYTTIQKFK